MKKLLLILFSFSAFAAFATHERAGEITYKHISGLTYEISITTYTQISSFNADRCSLLVFFGDGDSAIVCRSNFEPGDPTVDALGASCTNNPDCSTHHMGQWTIGNPSLISLDIKKNVYTTTHTYPGPYSYIISMTDPNRNNGIVNVNDLTPFSIQDTLTIFGAPGFPSYNNSVTLSNPPIDRACIGEVFIHNPGAVDPDGDSISYKLGVCFEETGTPIPGYFIPSGVSVNAITGDFIWDSPILLPSPYLPCYEYNFAIDIQEWKLNVLNGKRYLTGTVRRDMQVSVCNCNNEPPTISNVQDTCILATTNLTLTVTATDPGNNDIATFTASGDPFNTTPIATFISDAPMQSPSTGIFSWTPTCNHVRLQPYLVTFKALDDGAPDNPPIPLTDYETFFIRVIAPAPQNLSAVPQCTKMILTWDTAMCNPSGNPLYKYKVYRKLGCDTLQPGFCDTGMPAGWGYSLIATVSNATTSYTDISGLAHGNVYSYRVVAVYLDGSESYVSDPICNSLVRDVPIITHVDVTATGSTNGVIDVKWLKPLANPQNLDTTLAVNQGPYKFELLRSTGTGNPVQPPIATFTSPYFATLNTTSYSDVGLNTAASAYTYRIEFYSNTNSVQCPTRNASSVFLTCNSSDNQVQISWNEQVPWTNYQYDVYRYNSSTTGWDSIASTTLKTFTDTGLTNGVQYCYKVKSIGAYPDTTLPKPLINWSQELCCTAIDLTPPCATVIAVDSSCDLSQNILTWTNPNTTCSDDAMYYIIYRTDSTAGDFYVVDTIFDINTTTFLDDSLNSIAGCYAVTSVDSFGNESAFSNLVCVDNCPYYQLPNVFTPNGDGINDIFTPLHPYKYVQSIDIKIYNRWGTEVFRTFDPEIGWNGISMQSNTPCSDGVYYYVCIVYDIRLQGIIPHVLTGNVHLLSK